MGIRRRQVQTIVVLYPKGSYFGGDETDELQKATDKKQAARVRKQLEESIVGSADVFGAKRFFLSDDFSLVDCSIAPILWRLPVFGIELKGHVQPIRRYMDIVFSRRSFQESLSDAEQEMRQ